MNEIPMWIATLVGQLVLELEAMRQAAQVHKPDESDGEE